MMGQFYNLSLTRPLCVLDCEATGTSPLSDRLVEVAVIKFLPQGSPLSFTRLIHPGVPIPPDASRVHGITDATVASCPPFPAIAPELAQFLHDCDLAGYNLKRFDLPFLCAEFDRAGIELSLAGRAVIDVMQIYHQREPRDLTAAVKHYLDVDYPAAHRALLDAAATAAVLDIQLAWYTDLPRSIPELHGAFCDVDVAGRFRRDGSGQVVFGFGKYLGRPLEEVAGQDPSYLEWILRQAFLPDVKGLVTHALTSQSTGEGPSGS